jgi:hypothetical protein
VAMVWADIGRELVKGADVILGALLGAGSAFVASFFADRRRFKREDTYRDYAERREVYAEFLSSWRDLESHSGESELEEWFRGEDRQKVERSLAVIRLIAPGLVEQAAERTLEGGGVLDFIRLAREDLGKRPPDGGRSRGPRFLR